MTVDIRKILGKPKNTCRVYISTTYKDRKQVKALGAQYDTSVSSFYFIVGLDEDLPTYEYMPKYVTPLTFTSQQRLQLLGRHENKYKKILRDKHDFLHNLDKKHNRLLKIHDLYKEIPHKKNEGMCLISKLDKIFN